LQPEPLDAGLLYAAFFVRPGFCSSGWDFGDFWDFSLFFYHDRIFI
jgi:hypothetical protein